MAAPQIDVVFDPPLPGDSGSVFDTKAFAFVEDLNPWAVDANALATYVNARALEAEAAVLTGDVTPNVANALDLVRLNAAGTGLEYVDLVALKASTGDAEAGTGDGVMDPVLTKAAIEAQFNVSGAAPKYACRAWVNFNGTGTVAIRASGNVSSITDNGAGDYTVNFTTAMPDADYSAVATTEYLTGGQGACARNYAVSSVGVIAMNTSTGGFRDSANISVSIFR